MCLMNSRVRYLENRQYRTVLFSNFYTITSLRSTPKTLPHCAHRKVDFKLEFRHLAHLLRMLETEIRETPRLKPEVNQDCVKDRQILDHRTKNIRESEPIQHATAEHEGLTMSNM